MSETFKFDETGSVTFKTEDNNKIFLLQSKLNPIKVDLSNKKGSS